MKKILMLLTASILSLFGATFNVATTPELRAALSTAGTNREDDTIIIADGTYKTTDDGQGTFIYLSNEANKLTLQGSSSQNVILSGDSQHQILNHKSTVETLLALEKLSFVDGNNTIGKGGGVHTECSINVANCNFTNNSAGDQGGGFYSGDTTTVTNSTFKNNSAAARSGGGFYSYNITTVTNSTFTNNSAVTGGGFESLLNTPTVTGTTFTNNSARAYGGGFFTWGRPIVTNSIFRNNSANINGGGFYSSGTLTVTNSIFRNNGNAVYIKGGDKNIIANSIFVDNNISDINGISEAIISNLESNYLDTSKVTVSSFKKNNIFNGINLGFVDEANGDYRLTESSGLIDKGTSTITGITFPATDLDGNARIVGGGIDIGPYEFSTTKPTITAFTNSGTAKELSPLTFNVTYSLSSGRTLGNISYDYTNDGSWTSLNTHTFSTAGSYTVNVKVTDSAGEYSTQSVTITIAPLAFNDMTAEQKLVKAIDPIYYDEIMTIIANDKESSRQSAITVGENNVLLDPSAYNLIAKTALTVSQNEIESLPSGFTLIGTKANITDLSIFNDASIIWTYVDGVWNAYSSNSATRQKIIDANIPLITNIPANSGIWVSK